MQIPTSQIGDKLIEYKLLKPFRKIYQVDIPLNHQASLVFPKGESIYNDNSMSKIGGRVFDIEIDLIDVFGFDTQLCLNDAAAVYGNSEEYLSHLLVGAQFVSSKIMPTLKLKSFRYICGKRHTTTIVAWLGSAPTVQVPGTVLLMSQALSGRNRTKEAGRICLKLLLIS